jgi:hypothetical protein
MTAVTQRIGILRGLSIIPEGVVAAHTLADHRAETQPSVLGPVRALTRKQRVVPSVLCGALKTLEIVELKLFSPRPIPADNGSTVPFSSVISTSHHTLSVALFLQLT